MFGMLHCTAVCCYLPMIIVIIPSAISDSFLFLIAEQQRVLFLQLLVLFA